MTWPPAGIVGDEGGSRLIFIVFGTAAYHRDQQDSHHVRPYLEDEVLDGGAGEVGGEEQDGGGGGGG